jgi:asparagine synthase (glutamine-hydrolysing)
MCGIAGISCRPGLVPDAAMLDAMEAALVHRGPDGGGRYCCNGAGLVHRRLSIVDLDGGAQPILSDDAALIANGEIYNDPELRAAMPDTEFATGSDCEPALHLWRDEGLGFAGRLRGMYAIAVAQTRGSGHEIMLARDPFGIKPLYLAQCPSGIAFASEPEALLAAGIGRREARDSARDELLQLQFTTGSDTIFPGIRRVNPGETVHLVDGRIATQRRVPALPRASGVFTSEAPALAALDAALADSVRAHLRADVPVGMFLSGGIDSAAVLATMARVGDARPVAWTARFDVPGSADESVHARALAQAVGADHRVMTITRDMVWRDLPKIVACLDDPVADYATIPTWFLAQEAAREVKVVLSGEGGDELFAGYGRYRRAMRPWWRGGRAPWTSGALSGMGVLRRDDRSWRRGMAAALASWSDVGWLARAQALDIGEWLPNDLLIKLDRCLMAHAVEGRTPLLDPVVAAVAQSLPDSMKIRGGQGKWLLRRWLADALPQARPFAPKQGFTVPIADWIMQNGAQIGALVARAPCIAEIAHPERVRALFADASRRKARRGAWTLLFYTLWHAIHIDGADADGDVMDTLAQGA